VHVDYDLHGIVGVRLLDAGAEEVRAVSTSIGPPTPRLERTPDLVVRFVERLDGGRLHWLAGGRAAFTDDEFVLLGGAGRARPRAHVPLAQVGATPCELVCERGLPGGVPLLVPIVNLTALGKGWVPVHASAFVFNGVGAIAAGWAGGGKTGTLLAFMAAGAVYVSDDWVYVGADGSEMRGLPAPLEVKPEYLDQLPHLRSHAESSLHRSQRLRVRGLRFARRADEAVRGSHRLAATARGAERVRAGLARRLRVRIRPDALFGSRACALAGRLDKVFLVLAHDASDLRLTPADAPDVARRLGFALEHEWKELVSYYVQFRFAFPDARNVLLEEREGRQRAGVARALSGKPAYIVSHASPAPLRQLFDALSPLFDR
jgi:hypothetical protein